MRDTMRDPKETEPKEYVIVRLSAPLVAPFGIPSAALEQKYQEP